MVKPKTVDVRDELEEVLGGAVLVSVGTLLSVGINLLNRALFARTYTPETYGIFSLSFTLLLVFSMVASLGLRNGLPRQIAFGKADGAADTVGSQILWALVLGGSVGFLIGSGLFQFNGIIATRVFGDPLYASGIALIALAVPLFTIIRIISAAFRGYSRPFERVVYQGLIRNVSFLVCLGGVVALDLGHWIAIATLPLSLGITTVLYFAHLYRDNLGQFRDDMGARFGDIDVPVLLLKFSFPLMLSTLLVQLMTWMDILMLGYFASSRVVGLYDGVRPLVRILPIVWRGMIFMYIPLVSNLYANDRIEAIRRVYFILTKWFASATVPVALVFIFFPDSVLRAIFGSSFVVAAPALQLLATAFCVGNLMGPTGATLTALGRTHILMIVNFFAAVVNFGLNILLIPQIGLLGAALGTTVALVLRNVIRLGVLYRSGRIHALDTSLFSPIVLTGVIAAGFSLIIKAPSWFVLAGLFITIAGTFLASFQLTDNIAQEDDLLVSFVVRQISRR